MTENRTAEQRKLSYIGLGANLQHPLHGSPRHTLTAAIEALHAAGLDIVTRSAWYESAPVPIADQPWYVNGVVSVHCDLDAADLLAILHRVEAEFGRVRSVVNAPRVVDLDLLDHRGEIRPEAKGNPVLPHPRMHERGFVLLPLQEIAPDWRHPASRRAIADLVATLPADQITQRMAD
ncbi:MAG TPA: 2-amino-4-hydroxy-6-hydroxymethyldihydropteridine diphosphokinase [Dongiaceae bacterium]|nr:2-amino-4-hydroxy-6-hydroxymethyldihydropteridine diphosphokinase [Dongiaceae bacterium]